MKSIVKVEISFEIYREKWKDTDIIALVRMGLRPLIEKNNKIVENERYKMSMLDIKMI